MRGKILLGVFLVLSAVAGGAAWLHRHTSQYDDIIFQAVDRYSLDFYLVKALIYEESWFRPEIRGTSGEVGLMQISMAAAKDYVTEKKFLPFHEARLFEPRLNVEIGCWYLRNSIDRYQDTPNPTLFALLRYNAGEVRSDKWRRLALSEPVPKGVAPERYYLSSVDFPSTQEYVQRILHRAQTHNYWF